MSTKETFYKMIENAGFKGLRDFGRATGIQAGNILPNLKGRDLSIQRLFIYANTLKVPVTDVLRVFYPEEMRVNRDIVGDYLIDKSIDKSPCDSTCYFY